MVGMPSGELGGRPSFQDTRDLTPFRGAQVYAPVRGLGRRLAHRVGARARVPRLRPFASKVEKQVHAAVFAHAEPERLVLLARAHPGWSGLCYVMAGLQAYRAHHHAQAAELLSRGIAGATAPAAAAFAVEYLGALRHWIEVSEGVEVEVAFSEEAVCLALAHSLREIGRPDEALAVLAPLPPSMPAALASCRIAEVLGRPHEVVSRTEGLANASDLAAALLVLRARALRELGRRADAHAALREVLRRRRTAFAVKNAAATERALLMLGVGRRGRNGAAASAPSAAFEELRALTQARRARDAEARELWLRDFEDLERGSGEQTGAR
jgi:tetratricopeptide (TPR) repeat protein